MRRLASAGLALLLFAPPPPAAAGPLDGPAVLAVSGTAPASATVTLRSAVRLDLFAASITGADRFGGLAVFRGPTPRAAVVAMPALDAQPSTRPLLPDPNVVPGESAPTLAPGTYTFHLLGDGPVEVRVPTNEAANRVVQAKARSAQRFVSKIGALAPSATSAELRTTVQTTARTWLLTVAVFRPRVVAQDARLTTCWAAQGRPCGPRDNRGEAGSALDFGMIRVTSPMQPGPARRDALARVTAAQGVGGSLALATLTVTV